MKVFLPTKAEQLAVVTAILRDLNADLQAKIEGDDTLPSTYQIRRDIQFWRERKQFILSKD